jgi:glutamate 5-kinase
MRTKQMNDVKRIVIKVGSSSLTNDTGLINIHRVESLVKQVADLHNRGYEIVLVSSGAIAAGMGKLNLTSRPVDIPLLQAAAAVGQVALIHLYQKLFSEYGKVVAQLLLTRDGLEDENRLFHAKNVSQTLLQHKVIQIVNENDAVAVDEITFGDNDTLSAMVANIVEADLLILLSDIDGLYDSNPNANKNASLIEEVTYINEDIKGLAGDAGSSVGTGGMITKLSAAEIMMKADKMMVIANSKHEWVIKDIVEGKAVGTLFRKD